MGGAESQAVQLARLVRDAGRYQVHLACMRRSGVLLPEAEKLELGEIAEFPITSLANHTMTSQIRNFYKFLKQRQIDIVHSQDLYMNVLGMAGAAFAAVPARIAFWGWIGQDLSRSRMALQRSSFYLSHLIHANSQRVRDHLIKIGVKEQKIALIYNGLDLKRVKAPHGFQKTAFLSSLGVPNHLTHVVTIVANMRLAVKDHPMFFRAARDVLKSLPNTAFVLAGEGDRTGGLRDLAVDLGLKNNVFFIGRCERIAELLASSDVAVLSSKSEGFSNSVLEYMGAGLPVVATDVGGNREAIIEGQTGFLVESGDHEAMAKCILLLLMDPDKARQMGKIGRERTEQHFSDVAQLHNTEAVYERLLNSRMKA